ncbi:MAG: DUF5818 domain-containing protein [Bryobacteraceae bacterium]|jgi:hypothetical protein
MKRITLLFMTGALLLATAEKGTFTGVITDTMCGANHKPMNVSPDSKCVLECVKHDKSVKFALYDGKNVYTLSDQQTPEKYAGQRVKISGTLYEKTKILQVDSIEPAAGGMEMPLQPSGHSGHSGHSGY